MKEKSKKALSNLDQFYRLVSTGFYVGYIPPFPGTLGALQGILLYVCLIKFDFLFQGMVLLFVTVLGVIASDRLSKITGERDPDEVIIDEIAGAYLACLGKTSLLELTLVFVLFRIIDITKPFPIRKFESVRGGWGIMLDDLVAGLITNLVVIFLAEIL